MFNIYSMDSDTIIAILVASFFVIFALFIYVLGCIISIKNDLKKLVEIEEKKEWREHNLS